MIPTPMLDRIDEIPTVITNFLNHLKMQGYSLGSYHKDSGHYRPTPLSAEQMLAQYYDIDLEEAEKERQALRDRAAKLT